MIKGFFFDLDGTLVDTHRANFEAYRKALSDHGIVITIEDFKKTIGKQAYDFLPELAPGLPSKTYENIGSRKAEYYKDLAHLSKLNQPLRQFVDYINKGHVVALVTTAKRRNAEVILKHHKLEGCFDFVVCADDVIKSKPSPEAYEVALKRSGLQADEVVAFEDSESGRQAAESAGIAVITIKDFAL